jgi:hypothetical protein
MYAGGGELRPAQLQFLFTIIASNGSWRQIAFHSEIVFLSVT